MHVISIAASPGQLSKLRRGHKVRIKQGEGFNLVVHPSRYNIVSRAFRAGKGTEIALSPEEQQVNTSYSQSPEFASQIHTMSEDAGAEPVAEGKGIFGSAGDKAMKKLGVRKMAYQMGDYAKPALKAGIASALAAGGTALGAVQPELIPFIPGGAMGASMLVNSYLDNPSRFQGKSGSNHAHAARSSAQQAVHNELNDQLNSQLGTNYGYMGKAGLDNAVANMQAAQIIQSGVDARSMQPAHKYDPLLGYGIHSKHSGIVGRGAGMVGYGSSFHPPALASQPFAANFQFQHFLPVQYQRFNSGAGLYAGHGLY